MHTLYHSRLTNHLKTFTTKLGDVKKCKKLMLRKINEVVEYFGEDPEKCDTTRIFAVLQEFRRALTSSTEALKRRERSLAQKKQRQSAGL